MLNKFRYKLKARNYFHPEREIEVGEENFLKILKGEVFNPHFPDVDYAYMIVGVSKNSPLNCWAGQKWGVNGYSNAHESALWYGKFCCEYSSRIIVPGKIQLDFNPRSQSSLGRFYVEDFSRYPWEGGGFMQTDKDDNTRVLVSDITSNKMIEIVREVYSRYDLTNSLGILE